MVGSVGLVGYQLCRGTAWTVNEKTENTKGIYMFGQWDMRLQNLVS